MSRCTTLQESARKTSPSDRINRRAKRNYNSWNCVNVAGDGVNCIWFRSKVANSSSVKWMSRCKKWSPSCAGPDKWWVTFIVKRNPVDGDMVIRGLAGWRSLFSASNPTRLQLYFVISFWVVLGSVMRTRSEARCIMILWIASAACTQCTLNPPADTTCSTQWWWVKFNLLWEYIPIPLTSLSSSVSSVSETGVLCPTITLHKGKFKSLLAKIAHHC